MTTVAASIPVLRWAAQRARLTHTTIGYFFLPEPPQHSLSVPDFRTLRDEELGVEKAKFVLGGGKP